MEWYYWLIVIGVLVVFYIFLIIRQKRQEKQNKEVLNSFKVGDKVITHIGIYGKIKRIYNTTYGKVCVLEVGVNTKVDIELDFRYIAGLDEKTVAPEEPTTAPAVKTEVKEPANETKPETNEQEITKQQKEQTTNQTQSKKHKKNN